MDWAYVVTVSDGRAFGSELLYEGRFIRFCFADKMARRKMEQYRGSGAHVNIYSRWDGTCITYVA